MLTKTCKICGKQKAFNAQEWRVSRGIPAGRVCKKCIAEQKRATRQVAESVVVDLNMLSNDTLIRIGKCIKTLADLGLSGREPSTDFEEKLAMELRYTDFKAVCLKYIREILRDQ